jgi:hypothetical protein
METKGKLICESCKHYDRFEGCELFEDGAVPDIVLESNEHKTEIPGQINPGFYIFDETKTDEIIL